MSEFLQLRTGQEVQQEQGIEAVHPHADVMSLASKQKLSDLRDKTLALRQKREALQT